MIIENDVNKNKYIDIYTLTSIYSYCHEQATVVCLMLHAFQ